MGQAVGQGRDLRLALGYERLRPGELLGGVASALRVDEDPLALTEIVREAPQAIHLSRGVGGGSAHEVRGHPTAADVDRGDHLQLALDHEPQAEPVRVADHGIGERVVDDAGVPAQDEHRPGSRVLESLDLEREAEQDPHTLQVAARPVDPQVVDEPPAPERAAAEGPAGDQVDRASPAIPLSSPNRNHHAMHTRRTAIHGLRRTSHSTRSTSAAAGSTRGKAMVSTTNATPSVAIPFARRTNRGPRDRRPGTAGPESPASHACPRAYPGIGRRGHAWASTLMTTPCGSRTKKRRTPQGSSTGP